MPSAPSYGPLLQWAVAPFGGCEAPRARVFGGELTASIPTLPNLTWGKSFLPGDAYPMAESSWHLGVYSWSCCCVRWRWDGFSTRVHTIRCTWAPTATSLHARFLCPPLLKVLGLAMLIRCGRPSGAFYWGLGFLPRFNKRGGMGR
jgi:hypothetical protein